MEFFNIDFWRDFVSNGFATLLGVIIGIPIALWLSNFQNYKEEKERKKKILSLLKEELLVNIGPLSRWKNSSENFMIESISLLVFIKIEHWAAFSDGGELQWIKDPNLLGNISEAYNYLRMMKDLCNKYFVILPLQKYDQSKESIKEVMFLIERGIEETMIEIQNAIGAISEAEKELSDENWFKRLLHKIRTRST